MKKGRKIIQETRRWDDEKGVSFPMRERTKPLITDFPEPDLCPIIIDEAWLNEIKSSVPELPDERKTALLQNTNYLNMTRISLQVRRH